MSVQKTNARVTVVSADPSVRSLYRLEVASGRFLLPSDLEQRRRVCIVGHEVYRTWPSRRAADARRDRALARLGYRVLRLEAALVVSRLPEAVAQVRDALRE